MASIKNARKTATADASDAVIKTKTGNAERIEQLKEELHMDSETFWERMGFRPYSVQTTLTKLIARLTLYAIGMVASIGIVTALSLAMQLGGWPMFIVTVFEIVGFVLAFIGSWTLSDAVVDYIAEGNVSRDLKRASTWIASKLTDSTTFVRSRMSMH